MNADTLAEIKDRLAADSTGTEFISHSRSDVQWLIEEVERLHARVEHAEQECHEWRKRAHSHAAAVAAMREGADDTCGDDDHNDIASSLS